MKKIMISLALLLLMQISSVHASIPAGVEVSVDLVKGEYSVHEPLLVKVTYLNTNSHSVEFLKWDTALEGRIDSHMLDIRKDGVRLEYAGRIYKRRPPTPEDYITIAAKASISATVDMLTAYKVDQGGAYTVSVDPKLLASAAQKYAVSFFELDGDRPQRSNKLPSNYFSCSASQQSQLSSALSTAESYSRRARDDLQNTPADQRTIAERYRRWFGAYDAGRWNTVQDRFNRIYGAISGRTIGFDCSCTDPRFYAYVYPSNHYNMTLCGAFWPAPSSGTDSKAGTIIHEISHFHVAGSAGGTADHVYGTSNALHLANTEPHRAVNNAENIEYFAENTPFYSMPRPTVTDSSTPAPPPPPPNIVHQLKLLLLDD